MSAYSETTRTGAQAARDAASATANVTTVVGLGLVSTGDQPNGAALIFVAAAIKLLGEIAERVANDPPRSDYERSTYLRSPRLRPDYLLLPAGRDTLGLAAITAGDAAVEANQSLRAHLVAFERYQGAVQASPPSHFARQRYLEARRYATAASHGLIAVADGIRQVSSSLPQGSLDALGRAGLEAYLHVARLPERVLTLLYLSGVTIRELEHLIEHARPADQDVTASLSEAAETLGSFGEHLATWEPPFTADIVL